MSHCTLKHVLLVTALGLVAVCSAWMVRGDTAQRAAAGGAAADDVPQDALPRIPPKEPDEVSETFRTVGGFRMDLLAAEPLVNDPVAIDYDENGLAYVVEMTDYPYTDKSTDRPYVERTTDLPIGRVRVLEDSDGDGKFDRSTVFADGLSWPTGLAFWNGGVFVAATPDIWYFKDSDGDHRADIRRKVYTGFRKFNVQAVMNNLKWGLDHRIYGAGSSNGGTIRHAERPDAAAILLGRNDFRFDPVSEDFELVSGGARFGNTFDDWGNRFICNIRNPLEHVLLPHHYLARNPYLPIRSAIHEAAEFGDTLPVYRSSPPEPWRVVRARRWARESGQNYPRSETVAEGYFTSTSGVTIYRGTAYPPEYYGNAFLGEVAANAVHRETVMPQGVSFVARRADEKQEFVSSTDNWFRPVNFVNAPDGTLHVLDMYRETIEHPWSIPDDIKARLDLESGRDRGRIYRLAPPNFVPPPPPRLGTASSAELVAQLENGNSWWRDTAYRLLYERQDRAAIPPLRRLLHEGRVPLGRLHALGSLEGLHALEDDDLVAALGDASAGVREHAVRLAEPRLTNSSALLDRVLALADDAEIRVRFQVAFSLGEARDGRVVAALARIARRDAGDEWVRAAVLSSASESAAELFAEFAGEPRFLASDAAETLLRQLAVMIAARHRPVEIEKSLAALADLPAADSGGPRPIVRAVVAGLGEGLHRAGKSLDPALAASDTRAADLIASVLADAERTARDDTAPEDKRRDAIELLAYAEFARTKTLLLTSLEARQPQAVQLAAVRALAGTRDRAVPDLLLERYRGFTPAVRAEVIEALLGRPERTRALLDAVRAGFVPPAQIPPARRTLLMRHTDPAIREAASAIFAAGAPGPRQEAVARYRKALELPADRQRGGPVFRRECATCHRLAGEGHDVGPNLETVQNRTADELLVHILDPNREVSPNYIEYVVALADGRVTTGVIADETATSITLRRPEGAQETILRREIDELSSTGHSLMPEGLEQRINLQEMADLLAFLLGTHP